jgi:hypothetical protein
MISECEKTTTYPMIVVIQQYVIITQINFLALIYLILRSKCPTRLVIIYQIYYRQRRGNL